MGRTIGQADEEFIGQAGGGAGANVLTLRITWVERVVPRKHNATLSREGINPPALCR